MESLKNHKRSNYGRMNDSSNSLLSMEMSDTASLNPIESTNPPQDDDVIIQQPQASSNLEVVHVAPLPVQPYHIALPPEIALHSQANNCTCFGCFSCCFNMCIRWDCISEMTLFQAIHRYEEEFLLPVQSYLRMLKGNQFMVSILETLYMEFPDFFFTYLPTGSLREGFGKMLPSTSILATDHDIMLVPDGVTLGIPGVDDNGGSLNVFSILESPEAHVAGYLWLKLEDKYLTQWDQFCMRRHIGREGCSILSSSIWREKIRQVLQKSMDVKKWVQKMENLSSEHGSTDNVQISVENNGPALTIEVSATNDGDFGCCNRRSGKRKYFYADFTLGLQCKSWPEKAKGFFTSPHRENWPPKEAVEEIKKLGCHVVPKSSSNRLIKLSLGQSECTKFGRSPGLEWRYSFSQAEIILAKHIPQPVKSAYLAFKALVKRHMNKREGKICSFALKCIMFRLVERKPKTYWEMETICVENTFLDMLSALAGHLETESCPNYWIPEIDLFEELTEKNLRSKRALFSMILKDPKKYVADEWLEYSRYIRQKCCYCGNIQYAIVAFYDIIAPEEDTGCCVCCRVKYSYKDGGCCSSHDNYGKDPLSLDVY
ncbi:uncharacterized protein [Clytia hemisphaerica]|uniref:Uncharacterized protein n=1 Tax=Clytia hemisphaerica TaxID=252671 RepID=A0A7M5UWR9_9CNID